MQELARQNAPGDVCHVAALGSPSQPRDDHGKWTDGHGGGRAVPAGDRSGSGSGSDGDAASGGYTPGGSWKKGGRGGNNGAGAAGPSRSSDGRSTAQKKRHEDQRETADVAEKRARSHEAKAQKARDDAAAKRRELEDAQDSVEPKRRRAEELEDVYERKREAFEEAEQRFDDENYDEVPEARRNQLAEESEKARGGTREAKREAAEAGKSHRAAERRVSRFEDEYDTAREEAISRHVDAATARNRAEIERDHAELLERPHDEYATGARKRATAAKRDVAKAREAADVAERDLDSARAAEREAADIAVRGQHANQAERDRAFGRAKGSEDARRSAEERAIVADNERRTATIRAKYWAEAARDARKLKSGPIDGDGDGRVNEAERADQLSGAGGSIEDIMTTIETLAVGEDVPLQLVNGQAPRELRLFRRGQNPSTKGDFVFDDAAAKSVMSAYERMGRKWVIADYDHGSLQRNPVDPSKSARSAGKASIELRDGELWATNIQWTPTAKAGIEAGEWPSVSPAFAHGEDRRPTWLMNFGLTGNPALHSPAELIAANVLRAILDTNEPDDSEAIASTDTGTKPAKTEAPATEELSMKKRSAAEVAEFFGITEDEAKVWMAGAHGEGKKMLSAAVALSVGLSAETDEGALVERLSVLSSSERSVLAALGAKNITDALGAITGLQQAAKSAETLAKSLAEIQGQQIRSDVETQLSAAKDAKKLTPAEVDDAGETGLRATALSMGDKGPAWLKAHIAQRPVIAVLNTTYQQPKTEPKTEGEGQKPKVDVGGKTYAQLSNMEREELSNRAPELFDKMRAEHLNSLPSHQYAIHDDSRRSKPLLRDLP